MIEELIENKKNLLQRDQVDIWHVLKRIQQEKGDEVFGNLSFIGIEDMLIKYGEGRYNEFIHNFYLNYRHYFVNCNYDEKLLLARQKFNNQIKDRIIRR